jgi:hypothetical protein
MIVMIPAFRSKFICLYNPLIIVIKFTQSEFLLKNVALARIVFSGFSVVK